MNELISGWYSSLRIKGRPDEWESKRLLELFGINVPSGCRILHGESANISAPEFPAVLKVCDPDILHKTDQGGVRLNVTAENFEKELESLQRQFPSSPVLAETMCKYSGSEFILGGIVDPVFGPAVMAGAGGVLTELFEDAVFRLCPCSAEEAVRMLDELKISPVLRGYRGSALDIDSLGDTVSKVSQLFDAFGGMLNQVDINPIVFTGESWTALDCVLIMNE